MKDYKAECETLRGELKEVRSQLAYQRSVNERRQQADNDIRDKFKDLLIDVLGR